MKTVSGVPFEHLERQARRLQHLFLVLALIIAFLPGTIFFVIEIGHFRHHAEEDARHIAERLALTFARVGPDFQLVRAHMMSEMEHDHLAAVRLTALGGGRLEVGRGLPPFFPISARLKLPADVGLFETIEVSRSDGRLLQRVARVYVIHWLVALVLLAVYRAQSRGFHQALKGGRDTLAQLIHADKLSAIGELYAGLTHEINNPLGIVHSGVKLLEKAVRERDVPRAELATELETIGRHCTRIADITRSLLAFGRSTPFELRETSLNRIVDDVVALVEAPFAKQGIRVETSLAPSLPALRASPDHLVQVFVNLVNNSRDAMPEGGVITVRTSRNGAGVIAEVADTGKGIPPDIQDRIFEPFFTTKEVGKGTGLGLSVSYGIVQAHGGRIELDPSRERGALFRVTLPAGA